MINTVILTGRLGKDPELRKTTSGISVCNFSIAIDRTRTSTQEKATDWINCVAWRQSADYLASYAHKGDVIGVEGNLHNAKYQDHQTGKNFTTTEVLVMHLEIVRSKKADASSNGSDVPSQDASPSAIRDAYVASLDVTEDNLPL